MKEIKDMNLAECIEALHDFLRCDDDGYYTTYDNHELADRIHELTRWIRVSERMPTKEDADAEGYVLVRGVNNDGLIQNDIDLWNHIEDWDNRFWKLTHWRRITPPEDKP